MEDDNLAFLLNGESKLPSNSTTPIQQKREPLVDLVDNDDNDSVVTMTCLNDRVPALPSSVNNSKRHFDDIKLVRPLSATSQGSRGKKMEKVISYAPHLATGGNRNSTDNFIQSSIDVTLSSNSSPKDQRFRSAAPAPVATTSNIPNDDELGIVTIFGAEDNGDGENGEPFDQIDSPATPIASSKSKRISQVQSTPDVRVSRFDKDATTSKTAFARSQLAKRFLNNTQAQQRPIPIQSLSNTNNIQETTTMSNPDSQTATSLAATVAASVAVSVAQPFLKLQNDLEQRMNSVLDHIHQQQQRAATSGVVVPITTVPQVIPSTNENSQLLSDTVDTRMKYMEKVQEQQQQVLKQLVDMVNTTKPTIKSPKRDRKSPVHHSPSPPPQQYHFLDTLVGQPSPPVHQTKFPKKHSRHKKTSVSPGGQKRPSRVTNATATRVVKVRSPVKFREQPPNGRFNTNSGSPYNCSVCDRSRSHSHSHSPSRSRSRSPTKGLSPDSSYPRPYPPMPRAPSVMSDGFIPPTTTSMPTESALKETYAPFDKYLNNSMPPSPLQPKPVRPVQENSELHERIKQIDEAKNLLDENYLTLQRRKNDVTVLPVTNDDSSRIHRLVEQCVKQVTRQVREEVRIKLEQEDVQEQETKTVINNKKRPTSKTHLAFDRHSTIRNGKQKPTEFEPVAPRKPYSDAFMEAVYGRSLYQKIKKEGKQPYFKLKSQSAQQLKQAKPIEQIPVRDTGLKPSSMAVPPPNVVIPQRIVQPPTSTPMYEPEYSPRAEGVILLGPPQIRDARTLQPVYTPSQVKPATPRFPSEPTLTAHLLPTVGIDPSPKKVRFGLRYESVQFGLDDDDHAGADENEDDGQGIQLPGYRTPRDTDQSNYDGPRFPPTIPHDEGYRNREYDSLQAGAIDWIEQELIARFMSQLQGRQTTVPMPQHRDVISACTSFSSSGDDRSLHDRLVDALGQDVFRLYDVGVPVDQDLVQALAREVIEDQITHMIGFRSPRDSIQTTQPPPAPPPRTMTPTTNVPMEPPYHNHHHQWPQDHSVPTPQPTPPQSPPPPVRPPRVATPEITGQEISSESELITPRSLTPQDDLDRPLPITIHHSIGTPEPSDSPSPPSTPRPPPPRPVTPPRAVETRNAATSPQSPPPPPVIIPPVVIPRIPSPPPSPPRPIPPKARTPSPVSSTSSSSSSSVTSTSVSSFSIPYSVNDSPFSDHAWFDRRSEGQVDPDDETHRDLIMRHVDRLIHQRRRSSTTTAGLSGISPPYSPVGGTHTLSIGEVPPDYATGGGFAQQSNGHTTPSGSDESNHSATSDGQVTKNGTNGHRPGPIHIKYPRSNGFLDRGKNRKK